ncbi:MAG: DUF4411 family protein [Pseudomonadota bacterium]|jgi:hypothetical protein|nr:DUF4411 family protein [Pseudomonadota bacterium]
MVRRVRYLVDASVLMQAHRRYYRFGVCPGFWDCLARHHKQGRVSSIDRVRKEVEQGGKDELRQWTKTACPATFFEATTGRNIGDGYGRVISWAGSQGRYRQEALAEFATVADGWLVAYAKEHGLTVVTQEVSAPESKKEVKIPDVCNAFKVPCIDTFEMLESLGVQFTWKP